MKCDHEHHKRCQLCDNPDVVAILNGHPVCLRCAPDAYTTDEPPLLDTIDALPVMSVEEAERLERERRTDLALDYYDRYLSSQEPAHQ